MFKDWVVTDQNWYLVTNKLEQNSKTILKGLCALHGTMLHSLGIICEVAMYLISSFLLLELLGLLWRYLVWPKDDCSIHWAVAGNGGRLY